MSELSIEFQNKIKDAEECGLTHVGFEDDAPQFMGTDAQWNRFTKINN